MPDKTSFEPSDCLIVCAADDENIEFGTLLIGFVVSVFLFLIIGITTTLTVYGRTVRISTGTQVVTG